MTRRLRANPIKALQSQPLKIASFTDNADATGFIDFDKTLPIGAIILGWRADITTGFAGDTTATVNVGVSGTLGKFSTAATQSVLTSATRKHMSTPVATSFLDAAATPRVTVTGGSDFTLIKTNATGELRVTLFYIDTSAKPI